MFKSSEENSCVISFRRYEYKYLIPPVLVEPIRTFIQPYCNLDPFAQKEPHNFYTVKNLYLDSADYRTYWDVQEKAPSRFKLRIRTYDSDPSGLVKFEIKRRFNNVCYKTSAKAHEKAWPELFAPQTPQDAENFTQPANPSLRRFIGLAHSLNAEPKMLIQYERQAFQSRIDRYVRISFDRRICHQPKSTYDFSAHPAIWVYCDNSNSAVGIGRHVILEIKMMANPPIWLMDLVRRFELVRGGHSKYCDAVTRVLNKAQIVRTSSLAVPAAMLARKGCS